MSDVIKISHSQLQTFDRCKFAWHLNYERGIVPVETKPYLDLGSYIHKLLQAYYEAVKTGQSHKEAYEAVKELGALRIQSAGNNLDALEIATKGLHLVRRYVFDFAQYHDRGWTILGVEHHFEIPFVSPGGIDFLLEGYVDLVYQRPDGKIWIVDHKTANGKQNFYTDIQILMDPQLPIYVAGLRQEGKDIFGITYNLMNTYDYKDFNDVDHEKLFKRMDTYRIPKELDNQVRQLGYAIDEREALRTTNIRRRSLRRDCDRCAYQEPCLLDMKGIDVTPVLEANYKLKD